MSRHRRRRHAFSRRELPHAYSRRAADGDEQRHLATRHAERVHLAPELAGELEENGPQLVRDGERIGGDGVAGNSLTRLTKASPPPAVGYPARAKSWQPSRDGRRASRSSEPGRWRRISRCRSSCSIPTATIVFYNEAAEAILGDTFEAAGEAVERGSGRRPSRRSGRTARRSPCTSCRRAWRCSSAGPTTWISSTRASTEIAATSP